MRRKGNAADRGICVCKAPGASPAAKTAQASCGHSWAKMSSKQSAPALSPVFLDLLAGIRKSYFSRDPELWPVVRDPSLARVAEARRDHRPPDYDAHDRWEPLPGEKAVFMNPLTDRCHIDAFLARLRG